MEGLQNYTQIIEDTSNIEWLVRGTWDGTNCNVTLPSKPSFGLICAEKFTNNKTASYIFYSKIISNFYEGNALSTVMPYDFTSGTGLYDQGTSLQTPETLYYILYWYNSKINFSYTNDQYTTYFGNYTPSFSSTYMPLEYIFWKKKE